MPQDITLEKYPDILKKLEKLDEQDCHLLLGNGFNLSLGIDTRYKEIFNKMKADYPAYGKIQDLLEQHEYDLEKILGELLKNISPDNFLFEYVRNKFKLDFMKATQRIVKKAINKVYQEKNEGIHLLLTKFNNYFTLNYDAALYLLLMKFKKDDRAIAFQNDADFIKSDLNEEETGIFNKIKSARDQGILQITSPDHISKNPLNQITKAEFSADMKRHFKSIEPTWTPALIQKVIDRLWSEKNPKTKIIPVNDGFVNDKFYTGDSQVPMFKFIEDPVHAKLNLLFLHGAFHIYETNNCFYKITAEPGEALYQKLEEILDSENQDIVSVFESSYKDKLAKIRENEYLKIAHHKLSLLRGALVMIGCSLGENDKHIFETIEKSKITTIYISCRTRQHKKMKDKAEKFFPSKELVFFDCETISYAPNH